MYFVMYAFSNHVEVLHNVTPIDLLVQSAVLSDGVVAAVLHNVMPFVATATNGGSMFQQPQYGVFFTFCHENRRAS